MSNRFTVFGIVVAGVFYSNRIRRKVRVANGIYGIDTSVDDIWATLDLADITDATKYFRKSSNLQVIRGVTFHKGIVPDNPVAFPRVPVTVIDGNFDELEYVETVLGAFGCYFLQTLSAPEVYTLMDLKEGLEKSANVSTIKNLTPAMRVVAGFHILERRRKEEVEPINVIKSSMAESGAEVIDVKKDLNGYEVTWRMDHHIIQTRLDKNFRVLHAGFCMSGYDNTQTVKTVGHVLREYVDDGSYIHITRSAR